MKIIDNAIEIAFAIVLVMAMGLLCIIVYNKSKEPDSLDRLTKYLITKDSLVTKVKLDSLIERNK